VRQVCDGAGHRFGISRDTMRSATLIPTFKEFAMDSGRAPQGIGCGHSGNPRTSRHGDWEIQ
jgi:hypothetical protein